MTYYCWSCVEREVAQPFDRCRRCIKNEDTRFYRAKHSTNHWSENTHREYRANLSDVDRQSFVEWERDYG